MQYHSLRIVTALACAGLLVACEGETVSNSDNASSPAAVAPTGETETDTNPGVNQAEAPEAAGETAGPEKGPEKGIAKGSAAVNDAVAAGAGEDRTHTTIVAPGAAPGAAPGTASGVAPTTTPLGSFEFTYYWMAAQEQGRSRSKKRVQLYTKDCERLTKVTRSFAQQLDQEGTGQLADGRTINISGECSCKRSPCYFVLDPRQRWGVGVGHRPLAPFRSVAVDPEEVPIGTLLYVPELDGLTMPGKAPYGGFVHDGCVVADDRGGAVDGQHIDFFVARKSYYQSFHRRHRLRQITVFDGRGRCSRDGDEIVPTNRNSI